MQSRSPVVVQVFDKLRDICGKTEDYDEFCWFAREYPRCYRFHFDGADYRLRTMHAALTDIGHRLAVKAVNASERTFELAIGDTRVDRLYWDFESYLSEINVSLDLLARVVGPGFHQQSSPSFNGLCKGEETHPIVQEFRRAKRIWVQRLKDYRDCFMHYTPVDTLLMVTMRRYDAGWELRAKLPTNPNVRDILGFRYSRRVELMRYAIAIHRHFIAFDKCIARIVWRMFQKNEFPKRKEHLFFVGGRSRGQ